MAFAEEVYEVVTRIPKGKVSTYKEVAHELGSGAYRAVGTALKNNPRAPKVPCHRVIKSDRRIGGFAGTMQGKEIERKISLLKKEGVPVIDGKIPKEFVFSFTPPRQ